MRKIIKLISGSAFVVGALLVALMVAEIDLSLNAYRQFQIAICLGLVGGVLNLLNWKSSKHNQLFTQSYWAGFCLLLIGILLFLPFRAPAIFSLFLGSIVFIYSFKWRTVDQK